MKRMESAFFVAENELFLSLAWELSQVVTLISTQRRRERGDSTVETLGISNGLRILLSAARAEPRFQTMNNPGEYAVGWFTLSLINAGRAQSKGKSGSLWWFLSVFLGPICTLLIVVSEVERKG
jgi:hypothetical protein